MKSKFYIQEELISLQHNFLTYVAANDKNINKKRKQRFINQVEVCKSNIKSLFVIKS
jgi:hypothetical protein